MSAYPILPPELPGELVTTLCPRCAGLGILDYGCTPSGELVPVECPECLGDATLEVCETCGIKPWVAGGLEHCGCTEPLCEACETKPADVDSICRDCYVGALTRCDELSPEALEAEYQFAIENGWIG